MAIADGILARGVPMDGRPLIIIVDDAPVLMFGVRSPRPALGALNGEPVERVGEAKANGTGTGEETVRVGLLFRGVRRDGLVA